MCSHVIKIVLAYMFKYVDGSFYFKVSVEIHVLHKHSIFHRKYVRYNVAPVHE